MDKSYAIIGSGIGGLSLAYYLLKDNPSIHIDIFEKAPTLGGLAAPFEIEGTKLEKYYHHIFTTDTYIIDIIKELGLESSLKWYKDNRATMYDGRLYPFNGPVDLLKFSPIPLIDRLRLAFVSAILVFFIKGESWKRLENQTADSWMQKFAGKKAYDIFWKPLLYGKFQERYKEITMSWLWSRIETRVNSKGRLGYMDGSFGILFEELAKYIEKNSGHIHLQTDVKNIEKNGNKVEITYEKEGKIQTVKYDKIIITTPSQVYTKFVNGLSEKYIQNVNKVDYISAQTIVITLKKKLTDYYWISVADLKQPALVFIEQTNLIKGYNGKHIIYLGNYLQNDSEVLKMSDEVLKNRYYPFLKKLNKDFKENWIEDFKVFRAPFAQPIVNIDYHNHIPGFKSGIKNIYILNMSQVYPEDRGMNFAIKNAYKLSKIIN